MSHGARLAGFRTANKCYSSNRWFEGEAGQGASYQFTTPDGHNMELIWEVDYYKAPPELKTPLLSRPQKKPKRGVPVRRLDHINLLNSKMKPNVDFYVKYSWI